MLWTAASYVPMWSAFARWRAAQAATGSSPPIIMRVSGEIRALVEQAVATLKSWRLLRKLRCSTTRIMSLVQAVLTLHLASSG